MNRRDFLLCCGAACALPKFAWAQGAGLTIGGRSFPNAANYIKQGLRCGTPEPSVFIRQQATRAHNTFRSLNIDSDSPIAVPVHVHVIHNGSQGRVPETRIDEQIKVLNDSYKKANVNFSKASLEYVNKPEWYEVGPYEQANPFAEDKEGEMKNALGKAHTSALNLYVLNCKNSLLGWATFPWELSIDVKRDGVVILNESLPGGSAAPWNEGDTATHEVGHWLGMFHTFQGGCNDPGDAVDDTPYEASNTFGCPTGQDSCPNSPGTDPITNFMDYTDDTCMVEFSPVQISRMRSFVVLFRPEFLPSPTVAGRSIGSLRATLKDMLE